MNVIKQFYIFIALIALMIIRPFASSQWMGSVAVAGLLVTWTDTMQQIWNDNKNLICKRKKVKYAISFLIMSVLSIVFLVLILVNLIVGIEWLNAPICLDEITLLSLLLCLSQKLIIRLINNIINM